MWKIVALVVVALISVGFALNVMGESGLEVSAVEYGDQWPFTVERGWVNCEKEMALTFESDGILYGLNGFGLSWLDTEDPLSIWKLDPAYPAELEIHVGIGPIMEAAETQC